MKSRDVQAIDDEMAKLREQRTVLHEKLRVLQQERDVAVRLEALLVAAPARPGTEEIGGPG